MVLLKLFYNNVLYWMTTFQLQNPDVEFDSVIIIEYSFGIPQKSKISPYMAVLFAAFISALPVRSIILGPSGSEQTVPLPNRILDIYIYI